MIYCARGVNVNRPIAGGRCQTQAGGVRLYAQSTRRNAGGGGNHDPVALTIRYVRVHSESHGPFRSRQIDRLRRWNAGPGLVGEGEYLGIHVNRRRKTNIDFDPDHGARGSRSVHGNRSEVNSRTQTSWIYRNAQRIRGRT